MNIIIFIDVFFKAIPFVCGIIALLYAGLHFFELTGRERIFAGLVQSITSFLFLAHISVLSCGGDFVSRYKGTWVPLAVVFGSAFAAILIATLSAIIGRKFTESRYGDEFNK